jgi:hypothetical protein
LELGRDRSPPYGDPFSGKKNDLYPLRVALDRPTRNRRDSRSGGGAVVDPQRLSPSAAPKLSSYADKESLKISQRNKKFWGPRQDVFHSG